MTGTLTYTVNADCTGSDTITMSTGQTADFNFLVNTSGATFLFISTDSGFVASGQGTRLGGEQ